MSWNRYSYTLNNPLKYVDPDGRSEVGAGTLILEGQATRAGGNFALRILGRVAPPVMVVVTARESWAVGRALGESAIVPGESVDEFYTDLLYEALFSDSSDSSTIEPTVTEPPADNNAMAKGGKRRPNIEENKAGRNKQGREGRQKGRGKAGWKPHNNTKPKEPPKHTPSQKD